MANVIASKLRVFFGSGRRILNRESNTLEFKESFNWGSRSQYARTIAAFANNRGGSIVFGIKNDPREIVGLQNSHFEEFDEARIAEYLNGLFAPEIIFRKDTMQTRGYTLGIITIEQALHKPVVSLKGDGDIREAEIYFRYNARTDRIRYPGLRQILAQIESATDEKWRNLIKEMGKISDVTSATIVESNKATPVRVTTDTSAPLVRVAEDPTLGGYDLSRDKIISEMSKRSKRFKANNEFNKIMRKLREDSRFCRIRYLYPDRPNGVQTRYYHPRIFAVLRKHYR